MSEILNNIWNTLSKDNKTESDFDTWKSNFYESPEVQKNVYSYLRENNYTKSDPNTWVDNVNNDVASTEEGSIDKINSSKTTEKDTAIERIFGKNVVTDYFGDLYRAAGQGVAQGASVEETFDIFSGKNVTDEDIQAYINADIRIKESGVSDEMQEYERIKNEAGGGVFGFMKGMIETRGQVIPQVIISSAAALARTVFDSEEAAALGVAGATAGSFIPIVGTLGGAIAGISGSLETATTFSSLLKEELGDKEFSKENIRNIIEDKDVMSNIKGRALARGIAIGAIEGLTAGLSRNLAKTMTTAGKSVRRTAVAVTGLEATGGMVGEATGQVVAGQEFDIAEVLLEGVAETKGVVNVADLLTKKDYIVNGKKTSRKEVAKMLEEANDGKIRPEDFHKIEIEITGDVNLDEAIKQKQKDTYNETQIDASVTEESDRKKLVDLNKQYDEAQADTKKKGIFKVANADEKLDAIEEQINEVLGKYTAVDRRGSVEKSVEKTKQQARKDRQNILLRNTKQFAEVGSEQLGFDPYQSFSNNNDFVKAYVERVMAGEDLSGMTPKQIEARANELAENANNSDAVNVIRSADGTTSIMINEQAAMKYGALQAGSHEILHGVMRGALKQMNTPERKVLISEFKNQIKTNLGQGVVDKINLRLLANYKDQINADKDFLNTTDEWFTMLSDIIEDDSNNITYQNNKGFFDGIKNKVASIFNKQTAYKKLSITTGQDAFNFMKEYSKNVKEGKLSDAMVAFSKGQEVDIAKDETVFSKSASDKVQSIYENEGAAGAFDIINEFKPIVSKIVEKRSQAPNFDRELLTSEIEIGKRGIIDLISEYKPESGVPLAAFINKFLPSRAIEASRRVLGEEFTEDVSERVDIAAEEVAETDVQAKPKKKKIVLADRLGVTDKVSKAIDKIVPNLDVDKLTFKSLKNKIPNITGELFGIASKKIESLANLTKKELQSAQMFINKNADLLIAMLPEGATASGTATGVPNTLLKAFYTKTERTKAAKTGSTAGLAIQEKNNINKTDFLETFGIVDGKPDRTDRNTSARVLALANLTGKMITNQAVRKRLAENDKTTSEVIRSVKDGKSKVLFSKSAPFNFKETYQVNLDQIANIINYKLATLTKNKRKNSKGETVEYSTRDLSAPLIINGKKTGETIIEGATRVITDFLKQNPQYRSMLRSTLTGGENKNGGLFLTVKAFDKLIPKADVKQVGKREKYTTSEYLAGGFNQTYLEKYDSLKENEKLKVLLSFFKSVEKYLDGEKGKPADAWMFVELIRDTPKHQNTFTRILAPFGFYPVYKNNNVVVDEEVTEEHTDPQNLIGKSLLAGSIFGQVDFVWKVISKSYMQGALLNSKKYPHDEIVNKAGFEKTMPDIYYELIVPRILSGELKLPNGYASIVRLAYAVHPKTGQSIDLSMYKLAEVGVTITEYFGVDGITDTAQQNKLIVDFLSGKITRKEIDAMQKVKRTKDVKSSDRFSRSVNNARKISYSKQSKGITVLDFDDTLATSKSLIKYTQPDGVKGTLTPEQYASTYQDLQDLGYEFDFSEFNKVVDGKVAPLFQKALKLQGKFGPENMFVLTARPAESAPAIFAFIKANGLNIPLKNITGLANSTAEAKALWIADKVSEGYNDFYFADDALQNVQAVDNMLEQFDVKRKVQQAKVKFSKSMNNDFNNILEDVSGIESQKRFDFIKARKRGASKGKFRFFIPPSHEDFVGLLYNFIGKGRKGDAHRDFLEQALVRPLNRANKEFDTARQSVANDYKSLNKQMPDTKKMLSKKTPDGDFTNEDAVRIYLWDKHGYKIPGLSPVDQKNLVELVNSNGDLKSYADTINTISRQETYVAPTEGWNSGDIRMDLDDATGRVGREQFFEEFNENADIIFSTENLNKIEAGFGEGVRSALEDILYRIKTGRNKPSGQNELVNKFMNWINGSVGSVMFFNMRSALLQQMSIVNYINFADNNVFAAAKAFANQKQYWADWAFIFNSDMLKQRRGGIQTDVNGAELAASIRKSKNPSRFLISRLLELGFLPTQIGDNIAIATGGASYYRNRINSYIKQGLTQKEAKAKAFTDFQDITQSTQQSARPDMVSQQQASVLGKIILNFQNVTSQFNRLGKKAFQDIYNRRITKPNTTQMQSDISNAARITYYFAVQNLIFYTLQTALFAMMFGDEEDDENKLFLKKKERLINGSVDSVLRGTGLYGGVVATLKNVAIAYSRQRDVKYNPDESAVLMEALNLSPVVGIKARKISNAEKTLNYNKKVIDQMEYFDIDNPQWSAATNYIEASTNIPLNRLYNKTQNVRQGLNNDHAAWQRVLLFLGWSQYNLNLENKKMDAIKQSTKSKSKNKSKKSKIKYIK